MGWVKSVTVTEVKLVSDSGKTDFVIAGEGATLHCMYIIEEGEEVQQVRWEKDGKMVYRYRPKHKPEAWEPLSGFVDLEVDSPTTVIIRETRMQMRGAYKCRVETNKGTSVNELFVTVIVGKHHNHFPPPHSLAESP